MATYNELRSLFGEGSLKNKVEVAVCMKAHAILQEATPSVGRKDWAHSALQNPGSEAEFLLKYLLAANAALTATQILNAADAALLSGTGAAVDKLFP